MTQIIRSGSALLLSIFCAGCNLFTPTLLRMQNFDLKRERGVSVVYRKTAAGLYAKPFVLDFGSYLDKMSDGKIILDAVNTYTVGSYEPVGGCKLKSSYSNFIDPACKFVNSWFGVYLIFDDPAGHGRAFMLANPSGAPDDFSNFNADSIAQIPELDQKLIVWSTHEKQAGYTWEDFQKEFFFKKVTEIRREPYRDRQNREWLKLSGEYETIAALTDTSRTEMGLTDSLRAYIGLPDRAVYSAVDPWYTFRLKGSLSTAYYRCSKHNFWAVIYYNGSVFRTKTGQEIDTMANSDIEQHFTRMMDDLHLQCE